METKIYNTILLGVILSVFQVSAQKDSCDWNYINRLGEIFQDTISPQNLIQEDPSHPRFGQIDSNNRWVAIDALKDDYFENCLQGESKDYFISLLGKSYWLETQTSCENCGYFLTYSMQTYDDNGSPIDPMPSTLYIKFDQADKAQSMYIISY